MKSNFIVACNKSSKIDIKLSIDLSEYGTIINSVEELTKYFFRKYGNDIYDQDSLDCKTYENCKRAIESGNFIIIGKFSTCCDNDFQGYVCDTDIKPMQENDLHELKFIWKFDVNKDLTSDKPLTPIETNNRFSSGSSIERWECDRVEYPDRYLMGDAPCDRVEYVDSGEGGL